MATNTLLLTGYTGDAAGPTVDRQPNEILPGWQGPHPLPVAAYPPAKRVGGAISTSRREPCLF